MTAADANPDVASHTSISNAERICSSEAKVWPYAVSKDCSTRCGCNTRRVCLPCDCLIARCNHDAKARFVAHHAFVRFRCLFERECLGHRSDTCHTAEPQSVFRVDGTA